jgi:CubicO group peptidase (beta-lactamase class C family)
MEISWSLGYNPDRPDVARSRSGSTFGMVGTNGSVAYADIGTGVAIALMRNRFSPDFTRSPARTTSSPRPTRHPTTPRKEARDDDTPHRARHPL